MENASKALIMAGGILVAILIIALLVKTVGSIGLFQSANLSEEEQERLIAFNGQYTKYLGEYVYGTELITVINKSLDTKTHTITTKISFNGYYEYNAKEWNKQLKKYESKKVKIRDGKELSLTNADDDYTNSFIENAESSDLKNRAFKCTDIGYDSYGRVNSIKFEEKKWGDLS